MLTPDELAAIAARAEAATEGPWEWEVDEDFGSHALLMGTALARGCSNLVNHKIDWEHGLFLDDGEQFDEAEATIEFIAHARQDIPALLAEVAEVKRQRDEARADVAFYKMHPEACLTCFGTRGDGDSSGLIPCGDCNGTGRSALAEVEMQRDMLAEALRGLAKWPPEHPRAVGRIDAHAIAREALAAAGLPLEVQ